MTAKPLKRIYFDTNILYGWPNLPNNVGSIFGVANWVGAELCLPQTVEDELEGQLVRRVNASFYALNGNVKELNKLCSNIIEVDVTGTRPNDDDLRKAFHTRSQQLKEYWKITNIPIHEVDLATLLGMAINRIAPFEEIEVGKSRHLVTGLQDAAILFAIAAHMQKAVKDDRCAFISNDGIFHKPECREFLEDAGVKLEMFRSVDVLFNDLFDHVWTATRAGWDAEMQQIEAALNERKAELAWQVLSALDISKLGGSGGKTTVDVKRFEIDEFKNVSTELPHSDHRPPTTATYQRPEGSEVKISARAIVKVVAMTESWNFFAILAASPTSLSEPPPAKIVEQSSFSDSVNVSLVGTVRAGIVTDFRVTAAQ